MGSLRSFMMEINKTRVSGVQMRAGLSGVTSGMVAMMATIKK